MSFRGESAGKLETLLPEQREKHTKSIEEALICERSCFVGYSGVSDNIVFKPRLARKGTFKSAAILRMSHLIDGTYLRGRR